jgi:hypothetical protein
MRLLFALFRIESDMRGRDVERPEIVTGESGLGHSRAGQSQFDPATHTHAAGAGFEQLPGQLQHQAGNCQGVCLNAPPGSNPQCFINCTAQQSVCQANCSLASGGR